MDTVFKRIEKFWTQPLDAQGDAINWILFLGFVIVVSFMWTRVLNEIVE